MQVEALVQADAPAKPGAGFPVSGRAAGPMRTPAKRAPCRSGLAGTAAEAPGARAGAGVWAGALLLLLGGAVEAGVVAAEDEGADAAAVFAGGESDEALLEVAGHGAGVAGAGVPGGGVITW